MDNRYAMMSQDVVGELQLRNAARQQAKLVAGKLAEQDAKCLQTLNSVINFLLNNGAGRTNLVDSLANQSIYIQSTVRPAEDHDLFFLGASNREVEECRIFFTQGTPEGLENLPKPTTMGMQGPASRAAPSACRAPRSLP